MFPFQLEAEPLAVCRRCGNRVAAPLGPSFVYGIGAVGFQHCAGCGERWRCLWPQRRPRRRLPLRSTAIVVAAAVVLGAAVAGYASTRSSKQPELASATRGTSAPTRTPASTPAVLGKRYLTTVGTTNAARADVAQFLAGAPPITPATEITRRVVAYAALAGRADDALGRLRWPAVVAPHVRQLLGADRKLTGDLARNAGSLTQSWLGDQLQSDAAALHDAANRVRRDLGLPPASPLDDARFSLL